MPSSELDLRPFRRQQRACWQSSPRVFDSDSSALPFGADAVSGFERGRCQRRLVLVTRGVLVDLISRHPLRVEFFKRAKTWRSSFWRLRGQCWSPHRWRSAP